MNPWTTLYIPLISAAISAIATVALTILTATYVRLTAKMVEESRKSRDPLVTVDFEAPDGMIRLVVENHGQSPARNIRIEVVSDVKCVRLKGMGDGLSSCGPVKDGISYLTPSRKLKYYFGQFDWKNTSSEDLIATLKVSYEGDNGAKFTHMADFDFGQLREVLYESFRDSILLVADAITAADRSADRSREAETRKEKVVSISRPGNRM